MEFLDFKPGLVGGHCIGVDPYYLTHKAETIGYKPNIILAGRRLTITWEIMLLQDLLKKWKKRKLKSKFKNFDNGINFKEIVQILNLALK